MIFVKETEELINKIFKSDPFVVKIFNFQKSYLLLRCMCHSLSEWGRVPENEACMKRGELESLLPQPVLLHLLPVLRVG